MKVLHTVHNFPPDAKGGTETYVLNLLLEERNLGLNTLVFTGRNEGIFREELIETKHKDIKVYRYLHKHMDIYPLDGNFPMGEEFYKQILDKEKPDIIHVHHWFNLTSKLADIAYRKSIPCFITLNDYYSTCPLFFRLPDSINFCDVDISSETCTKCLSRYKKVYPSEIEARFKIFSNELKKAERVFVVSKSLKNFVEAIPWFKGIRFTLLPLPRIPMNPATNSISNNLEGDFDIKLVSWGGLVKGKGIETIVDACLEVSKELKVLFHHWGNIIDYEFMNNLKEKNKDSNFKLEFKGEFERDNIPILMKYYDVAVFPSFFFETHGFTVDEALDVGLPVIVSDRGAPKERIGNKGFVIKAGDTKTLAEIIYSLAKNKDLLKNLKKSESAPHITLEYHTKELLNFYSSI